MAFKTPLHALAAILLGGLAPAVAIAAEQPPSFRVMSYNIRYDNPDDTPDWRARRGPMAAQIRAVQPDVLGVQEALMPMVDDLARALPGYDHYGVGRDDGR
jgi:endonuclease/exonuclease/phosphatase family metal-dependent hydrolase